MTPNNRAANCQLIIRQELRLVDTIELVGEALTIGRSSRCDIMLPHEAVSRVHARLERRDDGWHVIDMNSINGTCVNGQKVQDARLNSGDIVEIHPFAMNYLEDARTTGDLSITLTRSYVAPTVARDVRKTGDVLMQRLEDLYALSRLVLARKDDGSLWHRVHAVLQRSLGADRCVLAGVDPSTGIYRLAPRSRDEITDAPLEISQSVVAEVVDSRRGLLIQKVSKDERFVAAKSLSGRTVGSVICVPMVVEGQTRVIVYADRQASRPPFREEDLEFAIAAMDLASTTVEMDELQARAKELSRVRGRIDAAREMQEMLLPNPIPQPDWGQVAAMNVPADQMSGDIYDVTIDRSGRLVVSIADVSGKGIPAAFVTGILQNAFRQTLAERESLAEVMERVNHALYAYSLSGSFATMVVCRWSPGGREIEIANAGHHAPLWVTVGGAVEAFPDRLAPPLGVNSPWNGQIARCDASRYAAMLLSSDGAIEARDPAGSEYGFSRLGESFLRLHAQAAIAVVAELADDVRSFSRSSELSDDITLLVVRRNRL